MREIRPAGGGREVDVPAGAPVPAPRPPEVVVAGVEEGTAAVPAAAAGDQRLHGVDEGGVAGVGAGGEGGGEGGVEDGGHAAEEEGGGGHGGRGEGGGG